VISCCLLRCFSRGVLLNSDSRWCVSDPLSLASPRHEGEINACNVRALFSPSVRGRAAEGGRGSLTRHLELELGNKPFIRPLNSLFVSNAGVHG
jgi:hypothetical protein